MEENGSSKGEIQRGHVPRRVVDRTLGGGLKSSPEISSPRIQPGLLGSHLDSNPRRESKAFVNEFRWIRSNRVVLWLMLLAVWAYIGLHVQSQWAQGDHRRREFVSYKGEVGSGEQINEVKKYVDFSITNVNASTSKVGELMQISTMSANVSTTKVVPTQGRGMNSIMSNAGLVREGHEVSSGQNAKKKNSRRSRSRVKNPSARLKGTVHENLNGNLEEGLIPRRNTSYGLLVGPFGRTEDSVLEWIGDKKRGSCDWNDEFAHMVRHHSFTLIFHELSLTGAPISMMELATEILNCGGSVSAVVLSRKGGLMIELDRRGIKVLNDRAQLSFKAARKSDLVIAGSAVCSSWIEQYLVHNPVGSSKIIWWIMENRREYFDRSKKLLNRVKMLIFLTHLQSRQWLFWCENEKIYLNAEPAVVPLSVNDELAFLAGIPCSLNTPSLSAEKMLEKRNLLRAAVRKEMGLNDSDVLVMSLSSINPPKGQRLFLESAVLVATLNVSLKGYNMNDAIIAKTMSDIIRQNETVTNIELNHEYNSLIINQNKGTGAVSKERRKPTSSSDNLSLGNDTSKSTDQGVSNTLRSLLSANETLQVQSLKVLIGSLGSKSNKVSYIKEILGLLSQHPDLWKIVFWTPATTRVASLYAAADVYVINAQGIGETFGRVTVEAMAFGLPVLGTDAGGTKEIVDHKITGLLHPVGHAGIEVLARNMVYLMKNPSIREKMGMLGRQKVKEKYLKDRMYQSLADVLTKCLKIL